MSYETTIDRVEAAAKRLEKSLCTSPGEALVAAVDLWRTDSAHFKSTEPPPDPLADPKEAWKFVEEFAASRGWTINYNDGPLVSSSDPSPFDEPMPAAMPRELPVEAMPEDTAPIETLRARTLSPMEYPNPPPTWAGD